MASTTSSARSSPTNNVDRRRTRRTPIIGAIATRLRPRPRRANGDRPEWCSYFAHGEVPADGATPSYPAGTPVRDIGYWNLLYDQLGDEGYDYAADGNGYTSNVINWNAADALENNNDVGSTTSYMRLDGGYSLLFETLAAQIAELAKAYPGSGIFYGTAADGAERFGADGSTTCTFATHATARRTPRPSRADQLFLAMPRRSLELVATGCPAAYMLNDAKVKYYLESSIDQPSIKAVLVFDEAWWTNPAHLRDPAAAGVAWSRRRAAGVAAGRRAHRHRPAAAHGRLLRATTSRADPARTADRTCCWRAMTT